MSYLVDFAETYLNAASTSIALNVPAHQTDDVLCVVVSQDANTTITMVTAGFTQIGAQTSNGTAITMAAWFKKAASAAETVTITTTDGWIARVFCIRDVDTTTQLDVQAFTTNASASQFNSGAVTTTTSDCFVLYAVAIDGIANQAHSDPGVMSIGSADNQGTTATTAACLANAWYIQRAAAATPTPAWTAAAAGVSVKLTVAFRNKSGGIVPAYIDDVTAPAVSLTPCHHFSTLNNISFPAALTATANINSKTVSFVAAAAQADLGINPYSSGLSKVAAVAAATTLPGFEIALTGGRDLSTGLIMGSLIGGTPKMGAFGSGNISQGGYVVRVASGASNWCAYQVGAKDAVPALDQRCVFAIQAGYTGSSYGTPGSAVTTTAVTFLQFLNNTPSFSSQIILSELHQVRTQVIAGGTTTAPVDSDGLAAVGRSFRLPVIQKSGGAGLLSYAPIQIGGGDAVNFQIDAGSLQFPRRYSAEKKEIAFHAADNSVGISYAGKSGDVVRHTNSLVSSPTPFYWEINSAATSAATWDFSGTTVIGASVTLRPVVTFSNLSFSSCASVVTTGSTIQDCKFSNTLATCSSPANAALITNSTFTKTTGTQHGIEISGTAANITLTGLTFTGYAGSDGSTGNEAIYVNIAIGSMSITILDGSLPSIRTAGATVTVIAGAVSATVNVKTLAGANLQNARVLLKAATGGPFPFDVTVTIANSGTTATVTHTAHAMATNDKVVIKGASHQANNGVFTITKIDNNSYSYTMGSTPGSNPTGTIKATFAVLSGLTDASGNITMSRVFSSAQPVSGWVRYGSAPYYKPAALGGTVSSTLGYSANALMIDDV